MERTEIKDELNRVFRKVFEDDTIEIHNSTTAGDIDNWDSMTHLMLITEIENHFSLTIGGMDIMHLHNVGNLIDLIDKKLN